MWGWGSIVTLFQLTSTLPYVTLPSPILYCHAVKIMVHVLQPVASYPTVNSMDILTGYSSQCVGKPISVALIY